MAECPQWVRPESDEQLISVVRGLDQFHRFISGAAASHILLHSDLKEWHGKIFRDVVPLPYYAGHYRSDDKKLPCLAIDVQIGGHLGAPYQEVPRLMHEHSEQMQDAIKHTDKYISSIPTYVNRSRATVQLAALYAGRFIQIHPFLNGNGRMSRLISNYVFVRYGYPAAYYGPYPRPAAAGDYATASEACMTGNFHLLFRYLLASLAGKSV
jgi:fido (protein-threonine AMPylation protein)